MYIFLYSFIRIFEETFSMTLILNIGNKSWGQRCQQSSIKELGDQGALLPALLGVTKLALLHLSPQNPLSPVLVSWRRVAQEGSIQQVAAFVSIPFIVGESVPSALNRAPRKSIMEIWEICKENTQSSFPNWPAIVLLYEGRDMERERPGKWAKHTLVQQGCLTFLFVKLAQLRCHTRSIL